MPGFNGIDVLKNLRKTGSECFAVFISSHKSYIFDILYLDIIDYLVKPLNPPKVIDVLERVLSLYKLKYQTIELNCGARHISLSVYDIILVESNFRKLTYYTLDHKYTLSGNISDAEKTLTPYGFLRTHKSYLINMAKVHNYEGYHFHLFGGYEAEISHTKRSATIALYQDYLKRTLVH